MKKIFLAILALWLASTLNAISVTMANRQELEQRLRANKFDHFMEKTNLVSRLAGKKTDVFDILIAVNHSWSKYKQDLNNSAMAALINSRKPELIEVLLQDNPDAIKEANFYLKNILKQ